MFQATLAQCKAHAHLTAALKFIAYLQSCLFRPVYIHIYISSVKTVQACFGTQQGFCTFGSISQPKFSLEWLVLRSMHCNQYFALWAVSSCLGSACDAGGHCVVAVHEHSGQCQHTCSWYSALGVQSCKLCVFSLECLIRAGPLRPALKRLLVHLAVPIINLLLLSAWQLLW